MQGYRNGFEIAEGLMATPEQTLRAIRSDEAYRSDRRVMELVRLLLQNFKKWAKIALISGVKGLNPFSSDKDSVEAGYYDARRTAEHKQLTKMLVAALGYNEAYIREDTLEKYSAIRRMLKELGKESSLDGLELSQDGFFYDRAEDKTYEVMTSEKLVELKLYAAEHPKFEAFEDVVEYYDSSGNVVVNAESVLVRALLEKDLLGREKEQREPEPEQQVTEDGTYRCTIDAETKKAVLVKYLGKENNITLPDVVKVNGQEYLVGGTEQNIFMDTPVKEVEINAAHWKEIYNPVHLCVLPDQFPEIKWLNLNQEQRKQLDENRERAEQHMDQEEKEESKEFKPIVKKKSVGMDI